MSKLPDFVKQGEAARLFPVLSMTSKEGRATSILLSCMTKVDEFAASLIKTLGIKAGKRTKIDCFTEVVFSKNSQGDKRPDGLILVNTGAQTRYFLVEAKIGNAELEPEQIENYVRICKEFKLDGVITISNLYALRPDNHPLEAVRKIKIKIPVYHWSWMSILTTVDLMVKNDEVADSDQMSLIKELRRFLSHESTGVKGFNRMPPEWSEVNKILSNQGSISPKSPIASQVIEAWQQEAKDLCLILSRHTNTAVAEILPRVHMKNPEKRSKADIKALIETSCLKSNFAIPNAASPIEVIADLDKRSIYVSMTIDAPMDRVKSRARVTWLLRQLKDKEVENCFIRANWPGSSGPTLYAVCDLVQNPDLISQDKEHLTVYSFDVFRSYDLGARFAQVSNFIGELEKAVPKFYASVGQNLSQWKKPAPKINPNSDGVDIEDIASDAESL